MASHKYIERKWKNGRWEYKYRTDDRSSDQLKRDLEHEREFRNRMFSQAVDNLNRERAKDPNSEARKRAEKTVDRVNETYSKRFNYNRVNRQILDPDSHQDQLQRAYEDQSLGTKIKSDVRSLSDDAKTKAKEFRGTVSKAISDKKAHNLMLKQNKKAAKEAEKAQKKAQKKAPKIAEKIAKSNKKISSLSPKTTKTGEDFITKLLLSDYQRMLLGNKPNKKQ